MFLKSKKQNSILVIISSKFISGAEKSFIEFLSKSSNKVNFLISVPKNTQQLNIDSYQTFHIPFIWLYKTYNPIRLIGFLISLLVSLITLLDILRKQNISIIYTNTYKAYIYALPIKVFRKVKVICHIRDNIKKSNVAKFLISRCDATICISKHIFNQLPDSTNKRLIYGGVDTISWNPIYKSVDNTKSITNIENNIIIACISQLTKWKNQTDFIRVAKIISDRYNNLCFLIVGDDLSGREKSYKNELLNLVKSFNLQDKVQFLGHREDIRDIMNQIDILVHPAIDEPFGRILIEAMAMEKSLVAYNCGGPSEIFVDDETGFLVEPNNYQLLAKKTIELIENKERRIEMGKAGRQRVIAKFNIERYVKEMEEVFDSVMEHE